MQLTETVTIINKSGKIISNGKHLANIFKEAKAAYQEKKATLKLERAERAAAAEGRPGPRRAQTYGGPRTQYGYEHDQVYDTIDYGQTLYDEPQDYTHEPRYIVDDRATRRTDDEARSVASSRRSQSSHRSGTTHRTKHGEGNKARPPLSATNLRTHTQVSSTAPSQVPKAYRAPYAETQMALSRPNLYRAATTQAMSVMQPTPTEMEMQMAAPRLYNPTRQSLDRASSTPSLRAKGKKEIDMNLAYGNIPPDLASRTDLDPINKEAAREQQARTLMQRIEGLLLEAQCVHHSATSIIAHLQGNPEAAAAVALTLAELSAIVTKMSPSFLTVIKGGFPAIFALLASPQFLIAAGVTVGVTVVCFGGWKIVKRIKEAKATAEERAAAAQAFEMQEPQQPMYAAPSAPGMDPRYSQGDSSQYYGPPGPASFDDALVLEEELSTIESWRRGIVPSELGVEDEFDEQSVDLELITPRAARSVRDGDAMSFRTVRTNRTSKTDKSRKSHKSRHGEDEGEGLEMPERRSSKSHVSTRLRDGGESEAGSESSQRSSRSKRTVKTIEDGSRDRENTLEAVLRPKDKKPNMLKSMFKKKKDREDSGSMRERSEVSVSVMA